MHRFEDKGSRKPARNEAEPPHEGYVSLGEGNERLANARMIARARQGDERRRAYSFQHDKPRTIRTLALSRSAKHDTANSSAVPLESDDSTNSAGTNGDAQNATPPMVCSNSPVYSMTAAPTTSAATSSATTAERGTSGRYMNLTSAKHAPMNTSAASAYDPRVNNVGDGLKNRSSARSMRPRSSNKLTIPTASAKKPTRNPKSTIRSREATEGPGTYAAVPNGCFIQTRSISEHSTMAPAPAPPRNR